MLIFISTDVQYLWKADFSFKKGLNCQNHSSSGSLHLVKKSLPSEISSGVRGIYPPPPPTPYRYLENSVISDNGKLSGDAFADPIIPI